MSDPYYFSQYEVFADSLPDMNNPKQSADWLIEQIRHFSFEVQVPVNRFDLDHLGMDLLQLGERGAMGTPYLRDLNNRGVYIMRALIESLKADDVGCIQARRGLRVPYYLELQYEVVFQTNYPAFISFVMQNVFFGNPLNGETKPWRSPHGRLVK